MEKSAMTSTPPKNFKTIIEGLAKLARLKFPEEEIARYATKLEVILGHIEKLDELDTTEITPTSHAVQMDGGLRQDEAFPSPLAEAILNIAPVRDGAFIEVPKVIDA